MSSLWTPDGEREVTTSGTTDPGGASAGVHSPTTHQESELETSRRVVEEMEALEAELLAAPAEEVIANHCYGLFQLAAIHLGHQPPNLPAARLAIDAFGAIVEGLDSRLGAPAETLRDGLAQLRLAFVQISAAHSHADLDVAMNAFAKVVKAAKG